MQMLNKIKSKKGSFYLDKGCLFQEMSKCKETKTKETIFQLLLSIVVYLLISKYLRWIENQIMHVYFIVFRNIVFIKMCRNQTKYIGSLILDTIQFYIGGYYTCF